MGSRPWSGDLCRGHGVSGGFTDFTRLAVGRTDRPGRARKGSEEEGGTGEDHDGTHRDVPHRTGEENPRHSLFGKVTASRGPDNGNNIDLLMFWM